MKEFYSSKFGRLLQTSLVLLHSIWDWTPGLIKYKTSLIPVVGFSSLVRDGGVVHSPRVEPLELSVLVVGKQFGGILLLAPVHISGLTGQSVNKLENIRFFLTLFIDPRY